MNISTRLARIETQIAATQRQMDRKFFQVVFAKGDDKAALSLARSHGWREDDENHFLVMQSLVTPKGQTLYSEPPYMLAIPAEAAA